MAKAYGVSYEVCMLLDKVMGEQFMVYRALLTDISPKIELEIVDQAEETQYPNDDLYHTKDTIWNQEIVTQYSFE